MRTICQLKPGQTSSSTHCLMDGIRLLEAGREGGSKEKDLKSLLSLKRQWGRQGDISSRSGCDCYPLTSKRNIRG